MALFTALDRARLAGRVAAALVALALEARPCAVTAIQPTPSTIK